MTKLSWKTPTISRVRNHGAPVLSAFCDNCGQPKGVRSLTAVCVQPTQSYEPKWLLLCGPCFVDGMS